MRAPRGGLHAVLRDPLYRWEVRRYWTARRYAAGGLLLAVLLAAALAHVWLVASVGSGLDPILLLVAWSLLLRLPLHVLAATGAALGLVDERSSGLLEQFQLTPVEPWRFHRARWVARLRGVAQLWALSTAAACLAITVTCVKGFGLSPAGGLVVSLAVLAVQLDAGVMVLAGAAAGAYFTAMCRTNAAALTRTWLAVALYEGVSLFLGGILGAIVAGMIPIHSSHGSAVPNLAVSAGFAALFLTRLGCGALMTKLNLHWARPASCFVFADPEDGK